MHYLIIWFYFDFCAYVGILYVVDHFPIYVRLFVVCVRAARIQVYDPRCAC
jgi:hypothetical protein